MVGHGAYVQWLAKGNGARKFINFRSKENACVPFSIATHFIHDNWSESVLRHPDKALRHDKQKVVEMNFTSHPTLRYTIHDFPEIEKSFGIDLWLYNLNKNHI